MKLIINLRKLGKKPSGIGIYTYNLVRAIQKIKKIDIIGITDILESEEIKKLAKEIKIIKYGKEVNNNLEVFKYYFFIKKILKKENPKYFWEPNNIIPYWLKIKNIEIITTVHDFFPITDNKYISKVFIYYFKFFISITIRQSNKIVCISDKTKRELTMFYRNLLSNKKVETIYNIVEIETLKVNNERNNNEEYFLYIGVLNKRKGVHILLNTYLNFLKEGKKVTKIVLAGKLEDLELKEKMKKLEKEKMIEYKGYITEAEKIRLLSNCKAFIFPSLAEGFGIPPIEALYFDKPLILSNLEIFKEILGEKNNYFDLGKEENDTISNLTKILEEELKINNNKNQILNNVSFKKIKNQIKELLVD